MQANLRMCNKHTLQQATQAITCSDLHSLEMLHSLRYVCRSHNRMLVCTANSLLPGTLGQRACYEQLLYTQQHPEVGVNDKGECSNT